MKISIIGAGYVGLATAVCFSELGHSVVLIETDQTKVAQINSGESPIYEKGLSEILSKHINRDLIATEFYDSISQSDLTFICVGTPATSEGNADLSMIKAASKSAGTVLRLKKDYHVIVVKSTVPPGTTRNLVMPLVLENSCRTGSDIGFAMNPEFLKEGRAIQDSMKPDRIIIGSYDSIAGDIVQQAYNSIKAKVIRTGLDEAEMIKYVSNAFLATKISFSNEIGNICKRIGLDVYEVMYGVGMDHRIGPHFLNAGIGFGGSCFPKDISALIRFAEGEGYNPILLKSVIEINERQPIKLVDLLEQKVGDLNGKRIAVLGLAFKDGTDDVRESRSIPVIMELKRRGSTIRAYDPKANTSMQNIIPDIEYCSRPEEALNMADCCLVLTEWPEFGKLDKEFDLMKSKVIIEGRRIISIRNAEGICW